MASLRGLLLPVARFWTMWRRFQRRSGRGGPFPPCMILSLRVRQFRFSRCFDATMGFPGEGPFALTPKLKEKETARLKAEAEEEEEKERSGRPARAWQPSPVRARACSRSWSMASSHVQRFEIALPCTMHTSTAAKRSLEWS